MPGPQLFVVVVKLETDERSKVTDSTTVTQFLELSRANHKPPTKGCQPSGLHHVISEILVDFINEIVYVYEKMYTINRFGASSVRMSKRRVSYINSDCKLVSLMKIEFAEVD